MNDYIPEVVPTPGEVLCEDQRTVQGVAVMNDGYIPELVLSPDEIICTTCKNRKGCKDQPMSFENGLCGNYETTE